MGMSTEEFERQKSRRFAILAIDEVPETVPGHQGACDYGWCVCEMRDGKPIRYIGDDACTPEDKSLVRDLAWVADALNEAAMVDRSDPNHPGYDVTPQYEPQTPKREQVPFHLLGRDQCEQELGFDYASASDVPFEQLQRVAVELHALRRFREAYDELQAAFNSVPKR